MAFAQGFQQFLNAPTGSVAEFEHTHHVSRIKNLVPSFRLGEINVQFTRKFAIKSEIVTFPIEEVLPLQATAYPAFGADFRNIPRRKED